MNRRKQAEPKPLVKQVREIKAKRKHRGMTGHARSRTYGLFRLLGWLFLGSDEVTRQVTEQETEQVSEKSQVNLFTPGYGMPLLI